MSGGSGGRYTNNNKAKLVSDNNYNLKVAKKTNMIIDGEQQQHVPPITSAKVDEADAAEDVYVQELRRMFNSCCDQENGGGALLLSKAGLERLCQELRLDEHKEYIIRQLLPPPNAAGDNNGAAKIGFESFKIKFIQLLPDLVDFNNSNVSNEKPSGGGGISSGGGTSGGQKQQLRSPRIGSDGTGGQSIAVDRHSRSPKNRFCGRGEQQHSSSALRPTAPPRRRKLVITSTGASSGAIGLPGDFTRASATRIMAAGAVHDDDGPLVASADDGADDTCNDILSEFSDDDRRRQKRSTTTMTTTKRKNRSSLVTTTDSTDSSSSFSASRRHHSPIAVAVPSRQLEEREQEKKDQDDQQQQQQQSAPLITASDVEQILTGLGLADRGYLGRYEFRILCQHLGLNGLSPAELNGLFNQLDKDGDGRIAVDDFLRARPPPPPPTTATSNVSVGVAAGTTTSRGGGTGDQEEQHPECSSSPPPPYQAAGQSSSSNKPVVVKHSADCAAISSTASVIISVNNASSSSINNNNTNNCAPSVFPFRRNGGMEKMKNLRMEAVALLGSLDESRTGHAKRDDVLNYWDALGVEDSCAVLRKLGISERQRWIDLRELSTALDQELFENVENQPFLLAAVLTLKAEVCFLKDCFDESREQAAHYWRELQQLNQRNTILVEEMDQSQQNLEIRAQTQFKELEEKHQCRIGQLESKYREEREQWHAEMKEKEERMHKLEQAEITFQSRLRQMEKENTKLKLEVDDLTQMVKDVEDLNQDLRQALKEAASVKKQQYQWCAENVVSSITGQSQTTSSTNRNFNLHRDDVLRKVGAFENGGSRVGLVIERSTNGAGAGKSTANKVFLGSGGCCRCASTSSSPAKKRPKYTPPSTAALLKRRRLQLSQQHHHWNRRNSSRPLDSSDFESEPEPIIFKPKFKRPLKKRQRLALIANREAADIGNIRLFSSAPVANNSSRSSTSTDEDYQDTVRGGGGVRNENLLQHHHNSAGFVERRLVADERKYYAQELLKTEIAAMEDEHAREARRLGERFEREKEQMRIDHKFEIESLLHSIAGEKRAALEAQEAELRRQFESQRRDAEIKWATERNVMERRFAEDKMEMMERLQNDFEDELSRLRRGAGNSSNRSPDTSSLSSISPPAAASMEKRLRFEQTMQENAQLNARLDAAATNLRSANEQLNAEQERCSKLEQRIDDLQRQMAIWETKYNDANRENAALRDEADRLKRDLDGVTTSFSILQQQQQQQQSAQDTSRVTSSDADVQTDKSLMMITDASNDRSYYDNNMKDESVQLDSAASLNSSSRTGCLVSALAADYERCHEALAKGVNELEQLLQSGESGFEEEVADESHERDDDDDPKLVRTICWKLRNRLTRAQLKFEEIRNALLNQAACVNRIHLQAPPPPPNSGRPHSAPTDLTAAASVSSDAARNTTDDEEEEAVGRILLCDTIRKEELAETDDLVLLNGEEGEDEKEARASPIILAQVTARLRDENFLLRARLNEQKRLTGALTDRLQQQMRDTVKVSEVVQKLFARCKSLETSSSSSEQSKKQRIL